MEPFTLSPYGEYLQAGLRSPVHGNLAFTLSTLEAGSLSLKNGSDRERYLRGKSIPVDKVACFIQTHSKTVALITSTTVSPVAADGGITIEREVVLSITVADCLPILLFDTEQGAYALVHSGWKGTGIALSALDMMRSHFTTKAGNVIAVIGPGIGSCCYNVPEERAAGFEALGEGVVSRRDGATYLSLQEANRKLLKKAGLKEIRVSSICTCCSGYLGSYRREGPAGFTRMLAVVGHI